MGDGGDDDDDDDDDDDVLAQGLPEVLVLHESEDGDGIKGFGNCGLRVSLEGLGRRG